MHRALSVSAANRRLDTLEPVIIPAQVQISEKISGEARGAIVAAWEATQEGQEYLCFSPKQRRSRQHTFWV